MQKTNTVLEKEELEQGAACVEEMQDRAGETRPRPRVGGWAVEVGGAYVILKRPSCHAVSRLLTPVFLCPVD